MSGYIAQMKRVSGIHGMQSLVTWKVENHIPINDPSLPLLIEESVKRALREKGESREVVSLLKEIKDQLQVIAVEIKGLKPYQEELIVFRDTTRKEAKEEIKKYFESHKTASIGYSELVKELKLDLKLIVELCSELENEGLIG